MCGIVGYVGSKKAIDILLEGLTNLEYRGYDSAGIAVNVDGKVLLYKAEGKLQMLTRTHAIVEELQLFTTELLKTLRNFVKNLRKKDALSAHKLIQKLLHT